MLTSFRHARHHKHQETAENEKDDDIVSKFHSKKHSKSLASRRTKTERSKKRSKSEKRAFHPKFKHVAKSEKPVATVANDDDDDDENEAESTQRRSGIPVKITKPKPVEGKWLFFFRNTSQIFALFFRPA